MTPRNIIIIIITFRLSGKPLLHSMFSRKTVPNQNCCVWAFPVFGKKKKILWSYSIERPRRSNVPAGWSCLCCITDAHRPEFSRLPTHEEHPVEWLSPAEIHGNCLGSKISNWPLGKVGDPLKLVEGRIQESTAALLPKQPSAVQCSTLLTAH